jgi:HD domain/Diguanylate cyclase, GGDEF domain
MSDLQHRRRRHWALYRVCLGGGFWLLLCAALVLFGSSLPPLTEIAPLLALAIVGEELVVRQEARSGGTVLSFSAIAHIASAILVGPLAAAAIAAFAVVIVDGLRPAGRRVVLVNSAMLGSSIWIAGECYLLAGGTRSFAGIEALLPLLALVSTRYLLTTFLYVVGAALFSGRRPVELFAEVFVEDLGPAVGEGSLGILLAFGLSAPEHLVVAPFLAPLLVALYRSKATLEQLKDETAKALESLAHVIDARDSSTSEHTERVTAYVERLLDFVELPERKRERIVAAAKFHDLGKIAVDVATLTRAGRLAPGELDAIRRHPRLSAFLLRPFHFARQMALFVELHHERYDGQGYYRVPGSEIPIEAHVLIAADSFDAMTSKRPYRPALSVEEAAEELLDKAETQFHPLVARAFAAMVREQRLEDALRPEEITALRQSFGRTGATTRFPALRSLCDARGITVSSAIAAMVLVSLDFVPHWLATGFALAAVVSGGRWAVALIRARRRERLMLERLADGNRPERALAAAGIRGWLAWLGSDTGRIRYRVVSVDALGGVPEDVLEEACRLAARHESLAELDLSTGGWLQLHDFDRSELRLALGLERRPTRVEQHLLGVFIDRLRPPDVEGLVETAPAEQRGELPIRRAVFLIDLDAFDEIRVVAGQLVAERLVDDAERRLRQLLRSDDSISRIGDDKFGVAVLVPDDHSLDAVRRRIAELLGDVPVPHGAPPITPQIVGAFGKEIETMPELVALDETLSPHARAWVAAT